MKDFDLEKLERKNIYKMPDNMFESIQDSTDLCSVFSNLWAA